MKLRNINGVVCYQPSGSEVWIALDDEEGTTMIQSDDDRDFGGVA